DHCDALIELGCGNGPFLPGRAAANDYQVVTHDGPLSIDGSDKVAASTDSGQSVGGTYSSSANRSGCRSGNTQRITGSGILAKDPLMKPAVAISPRRERCYSFSRSPQVACLGGRFVNLNGVWRPGRYGKRFRCWNMHNCRELHGY